MRQGKPHSFSGPSTHAERASGQEALGSVCLPFPEPAAHVERTSAFISKQRPRHVLFVDDEKPIVILWTELLELVGYTVTGCSSSLDALEMFRAAPSCYDVVVTDQTMPNLTGEALSREILLIRPDLPILICTGFSYTMTEEIAQKVGIRKFLMKPLLRDDLVLAIQEVMGEMEPKV